MTSLINKKNIAIITFLIVVLIVVIIIFINHQATSAPESNANNSSSSTSNSVTSSSASSAAQIFNEELSLNDQQKFQVFHVQTPKKGLLIYIADDLNNADTLEHANKFSTLSYYVAVIESKVLLTTQTAGNNKSNECIHIDEILQNIEKVVRTNYAVDPGSLPILVGEQDGAALVYAALAQQEKHSFYAGVSINFAQKLQTLSTLCNFNKVAVSTTSGAIELPPVKHLTSSWYIFQDNQTADKNNSLEFSNNVNNAKLSIANNESETPYKQAIQILQWLDPRLTDQIYAEDSNSDVPLIEVPAKENDQTTMALIITGDGGWAEIDKNVASHLAEKGIPTVALDSLSYFWKKRTPEETGKAIAHVINTYQKKWHKQKVIFIGYSFGADVLPFVANKLPNATQKNIILIALLGIGQTASFEFHLSSWLNVDNDPNRLPIPPEIKKLHWVKTICIYGTKDKKSNCQPLAEVGVHVIEMPGNHHFDKKYDDLVQHIIENANTVH